MENEKEKMKKGTPYPQPSLSTPDRCVTVHAMGMRDCLLGRRKHKRPKGKENKQNKHP